MGWMMGFDVNYLMLFCGAPGCLPNFVTDVAGHRLYSGPGGRETGRFDYREILA